MNNELHLSQVFQQIQCTIPGHNEYKVSRICVDKDCKESNLVCDLCDKAHKTHRGQLLTIAEVQESFLALKNSNKADANFQKLQKMVDDFETLSIIKLKALVSDFKQLLDVTNLMENSFLKNKIRSYSELQNQITQLLNYVELQNGGEIKFKILQPSDLHPKLHDRLTKYLQEINNFWKKNTGYGEQQGITQQDQPLQEKLQQNPEQQQMHQQPPPKPSVLNQDTKKGNLQQELDNQKRLEPAKIPLQDKLKNEKFSLQDQLSTFQFTPESCSQQIKCITPKCVQKTAVNIANDVACLNKPLSPYEKQSFVFRINRLKGYIGIGIAVYWSVEANNFMFGPLDEVGHGVFMVLNNGLVYNNSYSKYNRITGQIEFREGQKYRLTFDPQNQEGKQFTIQPLSQNSAPYTMPMQIDDALDYHVFVYMGQRDGEVELLNEI